MISRLLAAVLLSALVVAVVAITTSTSAESPTSTTGAPLVATAAVRVPRGDEIHLGAADNQEAQVRGHPQLVASTHDLLVPLSLVPTGQQQHRQTTSAGQQLADTNNGEGVIPTLANNNQHGRQHRQAQPQQQQQQQPKRIYTNQFVIEVKGGEIKARELAEKHGFIYLNHILGDYYHLEHRRLAKRSIDATDMSQLELSIEEEPQVIKFERQVLKKRVKRDYLEYQPPVANNNNGGVANNNNNNNNNNNRNPQLRPMAQPNVGHQRPAHHQYTRPANQLPSAPTATGSSSVPLAHRPVSGDQSVLNYQQQYRRPSSFAGSPRTFNLESLDDAQSGPSAYFVQPPPSASNQQQQQQPARRPPPPATGGLYLSGSSRATNSSNSSQLPAPVNHTSGLYHNQLHPNSQLRQYSNSTIKPAPFSDPSWPLMWYLDGGARNGFDLNVQAAWRMGYTGKGIVITILDDGLEKDHPDLQANYDPLASFDINNDDADPMPRYDPNDSNRHGTRCAGEVAAVPGNNICSIGIAYNSKVGGVRMLDGDVTDAVEARSLGLNNQHIHIYSASWGPDDNGKTVDGPGELATRAFIEGVTNGRQGLGSIFVFASGNGGREHDNCNCDGYTNSIWTLSISSATENGFVPWYIEACSSTLATTYSSGSYDERQIATTDIRHSCTSNHTGTSASAPLAAGICALVLESNPRLTWRDMQHIVVRTAKPANLIAKDWRTNAMGRNVSHAFGYGLMDAAAMITMAKQWTTMPVQYTCEVRAPLMDKSIPSKGYIELRIRAECANVRHLEHVQSKVTLMAPRRGDLHIYLVSPRGTRSTLLAQRPNDQAEQGFRNWPFMTVHNWGEPPNGNWTLEVHNDGKLQNRAFLKEWTLILYGTYDDPNKHLDPISLANSVPVAATPAPPLQHQSIIYHKPPVSSPGRLTSGGGGGQSSNVVPPPQGTTLEIESSAVGQKRPVSGGFSPANPPPPPPPLQPIGSQVSYANSRITSTPSPSQLAPATATTAQTDGSPAGTTTTTAATTTTSSSSSLYETTFKASSNTSPTTGDTPDLSVANNNKPHTQMAGNLSDQIDSGMSRFNGGVSNNQPSGAAASQQVRPGGVAMNSDFEVVAPPGGPVSQWQGGPMVDMGTTMQSTNHSGSGDFSVITSRPPPPPLLPVEDQLDGNKIELSSPSLAGQSNTDQPPTMIQSLVSNQNNKLQQQPVQVQVQLQQQQQQATKNAPSSGGSSNNNDLDHKQQDEHDANQLDSKQTKDYRSSGGLDQQQAPTTTTYMNDQLQYGSSDTINRGTSGLTNNPPNGPPSTRHEPNSAGPSSPSRVLVATTSGGLINWTLSVQSVTALILVTIANNPIVRIRTVFN